MKYFLLLLFTIIFQNELLFASLFEFRENSKNKNPKFLECMSVLNNGIILEMNKKNSKIVIYENSVYYISINANSMLCEKWGDLKG